MGTRTPLRDEERTSVEPSHGLFHRAEEWAEETGLAPEGQPGEGVPWHAVVLLLACLALLIAVEITLAFGSRSSSPDTRTERDVVRQAPARWSA